MTECALRDPESCLGARYQQLGSSRKMVAAVTRYHQLQLLDWDAKAGTREGAEMVGPECDELWSGLVTS